MKVINRRTPRGFLKETSGNKLSNVRGILVIALIILVFWQGLSLVYTPLVLPSPALTGQALVKIIKSQLFFVAILSTLRKLVIGLLAAILMGSAFGILLGCNQKIKNLLEPLVYLIQATPPILYMTMAMIWFGLNGSATIFIVFIGSAPVMAVNIVEGLKILTLN